MRNLVFAVACLAVLPGCAQAPAQTESATSPEAAVPAIARLFSECKLDELVSRYAPSIEFVSPSTPSPLVGRAAIRSYFAGACTGTVRPVMKVEVQRVRRLSAESAVVTGTYSFGRSDRPDDQPWPAHFVITLARGGGPWMINTQATFPIPESAR